HNGTVLTRYPDPDVWRGRALPEAELGTIRLAQRDGGAQGSGLDGIPRPYGFTAPYRTPLPDAMCIVVGSPTACALRQADRPLARNLAGLGMDAALALIAAWFVGDALVVRPLSVLVAATRRLRAGELSARASLPHARGEVGSLARAFDEMAEALEERQA